MTPIGTSDADNSRPQRNRKPSPRAAEAKEYEQLENQQIQATGVHEAAFACLMASSLRTEQCFVAEQAGGAPGSLPVPGPHRSLPSSTESLYNVFFLWHPSSSRAHTCSALYI